MNTKNLMFILLLLILILTTSGCGGGDSGNGSNPEPPVENSEPATPPIVDPASPNITDLDADYYIDYKSGTIPIGDLPIGARVVDPGWLWEFRTDENYSGNGVFKPVTWIVVAKNHYEELEPHVTLLAEELIGLLAFDDSNNRDHEYAEWGYNHWGESGNANATRGLRPWLNSTGIHSGEGFYRAFSENFKQIVLTTNVPNKEWKSGADYSTYDHVFIPSLTELGGDNKEHEWTYPIGSAYPYFSEVADADWGTRATHRAARLVGDNWQYWTRSPASNRGHSLKKVAYDGGLGYGPHYTRADDSGVGNHGVRPALNLKSNTLLSEIR